MNLSDAHWDEIYKEVYAFVPGGGWTGGEQPSSEIEEEQSDPRAKLLIGWYAVPFRINFSYSSLTEVFVPRSDLQSTLV